MHSSLPASTGVVVITFANAVCLMLVILNIVRQVIEEADDGQGNQGRRQLSGKWFPATQEQVHDLLFSFACDIMHSNENKRQL